LKQIDEAEEGVNHHQYDDDVTRSAVTLSLEGKRLARLPLSLGQPALPNEYGQQDETENSKPTVKMAGDDGCGALTVSQAVEGVGEESNHHDRDCENIGQLTEFFVPRTLLLRLLPT